SVYPTLCSPSRNAATGPVRAEADKLLRKPTAGIGACSACTSNGHVASPAKTVRNSRRLTTDDPKAKDSLVSVAGISAGLVSRQNGTRSCPLWVKGRHMHCKTACPLYPQ